MASRSPDLIEAVSAYLTMRRTAGYLLKREGKFLEDFARFFDARGQHYVTAHLAIQWAGTSTSAWVRINRLHSICLFAEYARAEEPRHEVPPPLHFGLYPKRRPAPYILTNTEIRDILHAASRLGPRKSLRPRVFETLFGLIAATGMRVSEAVALCYRDVDPAGLVVRKSKSGKGRVLPIHETTRQALDQYIEERSAVASDHDFLFVSLSGKPLRRETARDVFDSWLMTLASRDASAFEVLSSIAFDTPLPFVPSKHARVISAPWRSTCKRYLVTWGIPTSCIRTGITRAHLSSWPPFRRCPSSRARCSHDTACSVP